MAMHAQGHDVAVAGERGAWHWLFEKAPFPWIEIPAKGGLLSLIKSTSILRKWVAARPVDILHTHYRRGTLIARRLHKQMRPAELPILYTLHLSHMALGWPRRLFSDFGDRTHVASAQAREWLIQEAGVDPSRITLIPHGIDPAGFPVVDENSRAAARAVLGLGGQEPVGVYVGRLDYPKNVAWILDVAEASRERIPQLRLLIAGEGPEEAALHSAIQSRGLSERVRLLGHREPLPIYQAGDALLLPSLREGFSLVTAEAMGVGLPVLRTRTSGTEELIIENVTGRSTPIEHDAFVAAAVEFLSDPIKLHEMGRAAARHVRAGLLFSMQLERTVELYRRLAAPR
jgi:glycosyltransferase involved in cell wall biosynthesis